MLFRIVVVAVAGYLVLLAIVYLQQDRLLYLPNLPGRSVDRTPADLGIIYEDVSLRTADGERLHGWFLPASRPTDATVLIFHGNAGNISHRLETLRIFVALGCNAFIFDYRGYGESTGSPSEAGTHEDARAAWRHLVEHRSIDPRHIVLFGRSLGAAVAARLASEVEPAALIVESAFTSVPDIAAELYPWLPVRILTRLRYDTKAYVRLAGAPVLVIHSRDDEIIPFHHGERIFAAAPEPKAMLELRGTHNHGFLTSGERYIAGTGKFLAGTCVPARAGQASFTWFRPLSLAV